jgi:acyl dehydratase
MAIEKARRCMSIEDFQLGDKFEKDYSVSYEMVKKFSEISGDWNPAHHDAEYAANTVFKQQIAHGMISVAQFSGIFGMDMPGLGAIWMNQSAQFMAPVYLDKPYKAVVEVIEIKEKSVVFSTACFDAEGNQVVKGQGELRPIPKKVKDAMELDLA